VEKNDIKKALYKEKPTAKHTTSDVTMEGVFYYYTAICSLGLIQFKVPRHEMGEHPFNKEVSAQLLIRWLL
jgi:hypothetical protein